MFSKSCFLLALMLPLAVLGQQPSPQRGGPTTPPKPPQVDVAEVLRRGDMVVIAGEGPRGADEDAIRMATAPPPDESAMWFVTVIKTNNCPYCDRLHSDFQKAPELMAFVAAASPYKPWGHYNEYNINDQTQAWRLKQYKISGYPTLVIQPPRNGMWGDPRTVVYQSTGYDGNPKKMAEAITSGVRKYAAAMSRKGYPKLQRIMESDGAKRTSQVITPLWGEQSQAVPVNYVVEGGARQSTPESPQVTIPEAGKGQYTPAGQLAPQAGVNPPFATPPPVDPFNPMPPAPNQPNVQPSQWPPPAQTPLPASPQLPGVGIIMSLILQALGGAAGHSLLTNLLLLVITIMTILSPMTPTKLDDEALGLLNQIKQGLSGGSSPAPPNPGDQSTTTTR